MTQEQAQTIINQLGGRTFQVMTGAKNFLRSDRRNSLSFQIGRNASSANTVEIKLAADDTYTMEFQRRSINGLKVISSVEGVYCDMMRDIFTSKTGMYTSL